MDRENELLRFIDKSKFVVQWPNGRASYVARISVDFGGLGIIVKGFLIHQNERGDKWLTPPQYPGQMASKSHDLMFIESKSAWRYLEGKVLEELKAKINSKWDNEDSRLANGLVNGETDCGTVVVPR